MKNNWDKILLELSYRVSTGIPDLTNEQHLIKLWDILKEHNWNIDARVELLKNLNEVSIVKNKKSGNVYPVKTFRPQTQTIVKKNATKDDIKKAQQGADEKDFDTDDKKSVDTKEEFKPSEEQQEDVNKINTGVLEDIEFIIENVDEKRTQGGAGSNTPTRQQVKDLQTFTEKRMEQDKRRKEAEEKGEEFNEEPYVHPDVVVREVNDETLDKSMTMLESRLGPEKFEQLIRFISKGGGVDPFLTKVTKLKKGHPDYPGLDPNSPGYKRSREIIRQYLKNDGKCVVTGVDMKLSVCEPDHRIPYSSAQKEAERKGTSVEEERKRLDTISDNVDLMVGPVNQFKSSLIEDKLLNKTRKRLAQSEEAEEVKKLETQFKNERSKALLNHYRDEFSNGNFTTLSERRINEADNDERNAMMKSWNYMHPNKKELKQQIQSDPNYYEKLKKSWKEQGVDLPDNSDDVDFNESPFNKWMNRYGFGGGKSRARSNRLSAGPERKYMMEHFRNQGQDVPTIKEENERDEVVNETRQKLEKELNQKQLEIEKKRITDPNLSDKQKEKIQIKIDKMQKELE